MRCVLKSFISFMFFSHAVVNASTTAQANLSNTLPACVLDGTCKYKISTFAGSGSNGSADGTALVATFSHPNMIAFDSTGCMYIADDMNNNIRKIDTNNTVTTIVTNIKPGAIAVDKSNNLYVVDNISAKIYKYQYGSYGKPIIIAGNDSGYGAGSVSNAGLSQACYGLAVDANGNIFLSDSHFHVIKKFSLNNGTYAMSYIAGLNGASGYDSAGTNAANTKLNSPQQLALDNQGNIYFADAKNNIIRKLSLNSNGSYSISTVIGNGTVGFSGDNGPAKNAQLNNVTGISIDAVGNLYIADVKNQVIRFVSSKTGMISTIAGTQNVAGFSDNNGTALGAQFSNVYTLTIDNAGNIFCADSDNKRIRKMAPIVNNPVISTTTTATTSPTTTSAVSINTTSAVSATTTAALATTTSSALTCPTGSTNTYSISTFAGNGNSANIDGAGTQASFGNPHIIVSDSLGNFYVADSLTSTVRKIDPSGNVTTIISGYTPSALLVDTTNKSDTLYVLDYVNGQIKKYNGAASSITAQNATFTIIASNASAAGAGYAQGAVLNANLRAWGGFVIDEKGNIYLTDGNQIRKLTPPSNANAAYTLTTIAGDAQSGFSDGVCSNARFDGPEGMVLSASGNLYIADKNNHVIRKIDFSNNGCTVSTIAGTPKTAGYSGDCGAAQNAKLNRPTGVTIGNNNLYIADAGNHVIRYMHWSSQIVSTIAGPVTASGSTPVSGYNENNGQAIGAQFNNPWRTIVDVAGNVYVTDAANYRIRKLTFLSVK